MISKNQFLALSKSIAFIASYLIFGAILAQLKPFFPLQYERYAQGLVGTGGAMLTVGLFFKLEKKSLRDYGLNWEKSTFFGSCR